MAIVRSTNIKIKDMNVKYKEQTSTQGTIVAVDKDTLSFTLRIAEGQPLPCSNEWCKAQYPNESRGTWWIGQFYEPDVDRMIISTVDCSWITSIEPLGGRDYKVTLKSKSDFIGDVGDRFVINTRSSAYDVGGGGSGDSETDQGSLHMIDVIYSGDIVFDGLKTYGSTWFGASIGLNWGRVTFRNYGMLRGENSLLAANSDGIHHWRNRGGLIVEDSVLMNNLDDHINTKGECSDIVQQTDDYTYLVNYDMQYRQGDELLFFDAVNHMLLSNAFIKNVEEVNGGWLLTVDRKIDNVITTSDNKGRCTMLYNIDCSGRGSVIRNNKFMYSRRHAYITRSTNSLFMNNQVIECGGSALIAKNEIFPAKSEGPFPSSFTMRDNYVTGPGIVKGYYPVEVKSWEAKIGASAMIDGFLMENNVIEETPNGIVVRITHAKDVYLLNNTLTCTDDVASDTVPVAIMGSEVKKIDGLKINFKSDIQNAVVLAGCKLEESEIKNIDVGNSTAKEYDIR